MKIGSMIVWVRGGNIAERWRNNNQTKREKKWNREQRDGGTAIKPKGKKNKTESRETENETESSETAAIKPKGKKIKNEKQQGASLELLTCLPHQTKTPPKPTQPDTQFVNKDKLLYIYINFHWTKKRALSRLGTLCGGAALTAPRPALFTDIATPIHTKKYTWNLKP